MLEDKKKVVQYNALIENCDINKWCKNIENISNSLKQKQEALNNIGKEIDLINGKIEKLKEKITLNEREQGVLKNKKKSLKEKNSDVYKTVDEIIHQNSQMQKQEQVVNRLVMQMINYNKDKSQLDTELHTTEKNLKITTKSVVKLNDNMLKIRDKISELSNLVITTKKMQISLHENIVNNRETFYLIKEWCGNKTIKHSILSNVASTEIIKNFLVNLANYLKAYNTALFKGIIEKLKSYPCMLIDQKSEPEIVQNYQEVKKFDPNSHTESDSEEEEGNNSDFKKDEQNKTQEIIVKKYKVEKNDLNTNIQSNDEVPPTPDDSDLKLSLNQEKQQPKKIMPKKVTFKKTNQQKPKLSFLDELTKTVLQQRRKIMKGKEGNTENKDHSYRKSLNI